MATMFDLDIHSVHVQASTVDIGRCFSSFASCDRDVLKASFNISDNNSRRRFDDMHLSMAEVPVCLVFEVVNMEMGPYRRRYRTHTD